MIMRLVKSKVHPGCIEPQSEADLPLFRHFTEGSIAVVDIEFFQPVFIAHGWDFKVLEVV